MKDYYKILNLKRSANSLSIKKAYRKLATELHPDVNKSANAHEKFIEINEAYQVLNNSFKRNQYNHLYDYNILKKPLTKRRNYSNRSKVWESNIKETAKKGKEKGRKYASETNKQFKRRKKNWNLTFIFELVLNVLGELLIGLIGI